MRVLVTGSAGFIGTAVCRALEDRGDEVVRVDLMLPTAHGLSAAPHGTHQVDVRDAPSWTDLLIGVDAVCHQAAVVGVESSAADLPLYAGHNDLGTAALLAAMAEAGVRRLVLASSMVVYGEGRYRCETHGPGLPLERSAADLDDGLFDHRCPQCGDPMLVDVIDEDAPLSPRSGYAASKLAQEHYASAWSRQVAGRSFALRYHNVYGPGMPRDTPYSGVAAMFRSSLEHGRRPRVFEDGGQLRDFIHVDDVAGANLAALDGLEGSGGRGQPSVSRAFNVASGRRITIAEVAGLVSGGAVEPEITGEYRIGDVRHIVASPERARAELGFAASVAPEQGLRAFATAPLRA